MSLNFDPVWVKARCGTCYNQYVVNARTAPRIGKKLYCRRCWDREMRLRSALGWAVYDTPERTFPNLSSDDPREDGRNAVPYVEDSNCLSSRSGGSIRCAVESPRSKL